MRVVPVFFDFVCPWSYSARLREVRLQREEGLRFVHVPWELAPRAPAEGRPNPHPAPDDDLRAFARDAGRGEIRPPRRVPSTRRALRGLFYARARDAEEAYVDACFEAVFARHADLHDEETLRQVARESGLDGDALVRAALDEAWDVQLEACDAWAEALGVETTVTYVVDGGIVQGLGSYEELREALAGAAPRVRAR